MTLFIILGTLGLVFVVLPQLLGESSEHASSASALGAFLVAFGFSTALILLTSSATVSLAMIGGLGAGISLGGTAVAVKGVGRRR